MDQTYNKEFFTNWYSWYEEQYIEELKPSRIIYNNDFSLVKS